MRKSIRNLTATAMACFSMLALADSDEPNLTSDASYIDGSLETRQHIYYPGDALDVRVSFTGDTSLLVSQGVDVYIAILNGNQSPTFLAVENYENFSSKRMFFLETVSAEVLPEGVYQLGLILTNPGGDPANIADWYNGFGGLLDIDAIQSSTNFIDEDFDRDGEWDDDYDKDGFHGDSDEEHRFFTENSETALDSDRDWDDDDWDSDDSDSDSSDSDSDGSDSDSDGSDNDSDSDSNDADDS